MFYVGFVIVCSVVKTAYLVTVTNQHSIIYTSQVKQKPHCIGIATMHELLVLVNSLLGHFRLNILQNQPLKSCASRVRE